MYKFLYNILSDIEYKVFYVSQWSDMIIIDTKQCNIISTWFTWFSYCILMLSNLSITPIYSYHSWGILLFKYSHSFDNTKGYWAQNLHKCIGLTITFYRWERKLWKYNFLHFMIFTNRIFHNSHGDPGSLDKGPSFCLK